jgi:hypothetical protein
MNQTGNESNRLKSVEIRLKRRFDILHFPNSTGLFTKPTGRHHTKYRFSPDIAVILLQSFSNFNRGHFSKATGSSATNRQFSRDVGRNDQNLHFEVLVLIGPHLKGYRRLETMIKLELFLQVWKLQIVC